MAAAGEVFGISKYISVPLSALLVWWIVVKGTYKTVEKVFLTACVFYIAYIISGVMGKPLWDDVIRTTMTPSFSFQPSYITMLIGVVGTTIAHHKLMGNYVNSGWYNITAWVTTWVMIGLTMLLVVTTFFPNILG